MILVNLENIYGPYCNAQNTYTPDAGVVRYAGFVNNKFLMKYVNVCVYRTPWIGKCELNLHSCCLPVLSASSHMGNLSVSTRFYIHLLKPPLCRTENVIIQSETGETVRDFNHSITRH